MYGPYNMDNKFFHKLFRFSGASIYKLSVRRNSIDRIAKVQMLMSQFRWAVCLAPTDTAANPVRYCQEVSKPSDEQSARSGSLIPQSMLTRAIDANIRIVSGTVQQKSLGERNG